MLIGEAPRLEVCDTASAFGSKRFLWSLRQVEGGEGEQLWAIQDHRHAYTMVADWNALVDGAPVYLWAWSGKRGERWIIRELRLEAEEEPASSRKGR